MPCTESWYSPISAFSFSPFFTMELTESVVSINRQLFNLYGIDTITSRAMWRIVWSGDEFEKRLVNTTSEGLILLTPIVREVPKYGYIRERYILEHLVLVPEVSQNELPTQKLSYEPLWTFADKDGNYLPPKLEAARFVIDIINSVQGKQSMHKYVDPDKENPIERRQERVDKLQEELFGNETPVGDALAHKTGIVVPHSYDTKES